MTVKILLWTTGEIGDGAATLFQRLAANRQIFASCHCNEGIAPVLEMLLQNS
jgi:hypothetical protein